MHTVVGLDVGGAHLKVAVIDTEGLKHASQIACPLWQGAHHLDAALEQAARHTARADNIAITMTAELSDLFDNRREGVQTIVDRLTTAFGPRARFWQGRKRFGTAAEAKANHADAGSANFLATAEVAAPRVGTGLVVDFGTTTTDIIPIIDGRPAPSGMTDLERQATGELVYTGLTRTAVMGIATSVAFKGRWHGLAREYLATMADVRRILGDLPEGVDQHATADGRGKSRTESLARFARMFGCDVSDASEAEWQAAAAFVARTQLRSISDGIALVRSNLPAPAKSQLALMTTGVGHAHVRKTASVHAANVSSLDILFTATPVSETDINANAPAIAVAMIAAES